MSLDDKTIVTFRSGNPVSDAAPSFAPNNEETDKATQASAVKGFQRPVPGGRVKAARKTSADERTQIGTEKSALPIRPAEADLRSSGSPVIGGHAPSIPALSGAGFQPSIYVNLVLHCACDVLDRIAALRNSLSMGENGVLHDPTKYREETVQQLVDFEWRCGRQGVDEESTLYARYILCTVIDEFATKTPWGNQGVWSSQSLLSQFHDETDGGEKFFQIMAHLQKQPATYLPVLELMYIVMSLGFEGKYSLENRGNIEIDNLRDNIYQLIRLQRGEPERDLSPNGLGVSQKKYTLMRHVPVWVVGAITGVVLLAIYSAFSIQLGKSKEHILVSLQETTANSSDTFQQRDEKANNTTESKIAPSSIDTKGELH